MSPLTFVSCIFSQRDGNLCPDVSSVVTSSAIPPPTLDNNLEFGDFVAFR